MYCTALYTVPDNITQYNAMQHHTLQNATVQLITVHHTTYNTIVLKKVRDFNQFVQPRTAQYNTVQHNAYSGVG